jgi:hypothetical protein
MITVYLREPNKTGLFPIAGVLALPGATHNGYQDPIRVEVAVNPERDEPPLEVQIPDDARELDRDVLAYHRELRARRRRRRVRRLTSPFAGQATILPLLASILAVCLVAGAMLSVATFSPATTPANRPHPTTAASTPLPSPVRTSPSVRPSPSGSSGSPGSSGSSGRARSPATATDR